jgi:hypothetical protein
MQHGIGIVHDIYTQAMVSMFSGFGDSRDDMMSQGAYVCIIPFGLSPQMNSQ